MKKFLKLILKKSLLIFKPTLSWIFLRNQDRLKRYHAKVKDSTLSGMVSEFNFFHRWPYLSFFKRVEYLATDIYQTKNIQGPIVFIMKNKGQLEYRYFNYLFLKEKISPVYYANNSLTLFWWPFGKMWQLMICLLDKFYQKTEQKEFDEASHLEECFGKSKSVLLNLTISRDYLFGVIKTNPLNVLSPLVDIQNKIDKPIHIVTLQFLYDKHPDKTERSYFDLLFGEKSQPGAIRKFLLFLMNFRRKPRVKFGAPINLKAFLSERSQETATLQSQELLHKIEDNLRIEQARITGPLLKAKETLIKEIMSSPHFIERIHSLAIENKRKPEEYKKEAHRYLLEIAADVNYSYIHFFHITLSYLWNNIYDGIVFNHEQLNKVREVAGQNPVILIPMHRSHIDYLIISDLFYEHNITFPLICGGDNLNFWPVGKLVRKGGGFFIRRRFEGNRLYKESLYAYIKALISYGNSIEFFIEGTRSRTGKLLKPKMGILSLIMRAYFEGASEDIYFVPISVSYDHLIEQKEYQREGAGKEKTKENAGELLKVRKIFKKKYGKVYIEFTEPISLKKYCEERSVKSKDIDELRKEIKDFAYHITYKMNKVALVTPTSIVSLAIMSLNQKTMTVDHILDRVKLFKDYLDYKDVIYSDLINYSEQYAYNEAIKRFHSQGILKTVETFEENFYSFEDKHRPDLDYYKNNILHFFVSLTCFCKILNPIENQKTLKLDVAIKQYELIKTLFRHDFTFSERSELKDHVIHVIKYCEQKDFVKYDEQTQTITKTLNNTNFEDYQAYLGLLDNFLESHLIGLRYIKQNQFKHIEEKVLFKEILTKAKPIYLKGDLHHPEALSKFNLENSFKVFVDLGILKAEEKDKNRIYYTATSEKDLIQKWIQSLQDFLKVFPPLGQAEVEKQSQDQSISQSSDYH